MRDRESGQILQISSVLGFVGIPYSAVYVASKHAVNGLVKSLRYELRGTNVRVWAACPGQNPERILRHGPGRGRRAGQLLGASRRTASSDRSSGVSTEDGVPRPQLDSLGRVEARGPGTSGLRLAHRPLGGPAHGPRVAKETTTLSTWTRSSVLLWGRLCRPDQASAGRAPVSAGTAGLTRGLERGRSANLRKCPLCTVV